MGLTTLGAVPLIPGVEKSNELTVLTSGNSAAAEAYRILRTNLQFASVEHPLRTLMISSPAPSEGKSLTVANLGAAFAQAGQAGDPGGCRPAPAPAAPDLRAAEQRGR